MAKRLTRREFIRDSLLAAGGLYLTRFTSLRATAAGNQKPWKWSREAMFYTLTPRGARCEICPNECTIRPGESGDCRNRENTNGKLLLHCLWNPARLWDPIEKKASFHCLPGPQSFSISTAGCNFACMNCQNWEIHIPAPKNPEY